MGNVRRKNKQVWGALGWLLSWLTLSGTPASAELLVYYDFNNAADASVAPDRSGKENHGAIVTAEYTAPGGGRTGAASDRAMNFLTTQDAAYVDIPSAADGAFDSITDKDAFTVSLWLNGSEEMPADSTVMWFAGLDQRQMVVHVPWSDSTIYFDMAGCDSCLFISEPDETKFKEKWNHYAFVKDGERAAIYQNGQLLIDTDGRNPMDIINSGRFGTFANDSYPYTGLMDDIAIWDEALSGATIAGLAAGNSPLGNGVTGDFNNDQQLTAVDIDALTVAVNAGTNEAKFDLNNDRAVNDTDRGVWVRDLRKTYFGDANLDGEFSSADFVSVFQIGEYEDTVAKNSTWSEGDWNGDGDFTSSDFVTAFQDGGFERGPRAAVSAVPEPSCGLLTLFLASIAWNARNPKRRTV